MFRTCGLKTPTLETSMVISGLVVTFPSAHSWWLYNAAPMGVQATGTMIIQSHYTDTKLTNPCHILEMLNSRLGSDHYQFYMSMVWLGWVSNSQPSTHECIYIYMNMYLFMYLYTYVCTYLCMHRCAYIRVHQWFMYVFIYACMSSASTR